jgi:CheY-like chemotaxis protein
MKVLIVDDDADDLEIFSEAFLKINAELQIQTFSDGAQLVSFLNQCPTQELPHLIVLDYSMPILDGPAVLKMLQEPRYMQIPKFILSTSAVAKHKMACLEAGAWDYFVKPSSFNELTIITKKMLGKCLPGSSVSI